jgi:hypothetical protein
MLVLTAVLGVPVFAVANGFPALAALIFGSVLDPKMPLILLGDSFALAVRPGCRHVPERARAAVVSAANFAAISTQRPSPARSRWWRRPGTVGALLLLLCKRPTASR